MNNYPDPFRTSTSNGLSLNYRVGNIEVSPADRKPCPVCGHPTGDCSGESEPPKKIAGFNQIESLKATQTVLVEEDIYENRQLTQFATIRVLIHRKGDYIPIPVAKKLGLIE